MLVSEKMPFLYGYSGGAPPSSLEEFTIRPDRNAHYFTANPWPKQPPFDEIGYYEQRLSEEESAVLRRHLQTALAKRNTFSLSSHSADAGFEYCQAWLEGEALEAQWHPFMIPTEIQPVVEVVRGLIAQLRSHPAGSLRASLELIAPSKNLRLELQNRGSRAFTFFDFQNHAQGAEAEIRLRVTRRDEAPDVNSSLPIKLAGQSPIALPQAWTIPSTSEGRITLNPNEHIFLELSREAWAKPYAALDRPLAIDCLLRVCFSHRSLRDELYIQQGWLMPQRLIVAE